MAAVTELFRQWLEGKQKKSGLTLTQFAKNVGVSHPTISRLMDLRPEKTPPVPSLDVLEKLAVYTATDVRELVAMLVSEESLSGTVSVVDDVEIRVMAELLLSVRSDYREMLLTLLRGGRLPGQVNSCSLKPVYRLFRAIKPDAEILTFS
jgi:transcriptional regulator with XRE-family HTH domain